MMSLILKSLTQSVFKLFGVSGLLLLCINNNNNNRRLVTLAEHTSDHYYVLYPDMCNLLDGLVALGCIML